MHNPPRRESIHFEQRLGMGKQVSNLLKCLALLSALAACDRQQASAPDTHAQSPVRPTDLILITVDTLRADHVGILGGDPGATPALDELGRSGVTFLDATAHAPLTLPAHASIMTGRYPPKHGIRDNAGFTLLATVPTLASLLKASGYHTAAFVSSYVLRASAGLSRGFDLYDDQFEGMGQEHLTLSSLERRGPVVARQAAAWLADAPHPYFLWVHFYDPHAPYDPPPAFAARFPGEALRWRDCGERFRRRHAARSCCPPTDGPGRSSWRRLITGKPLASTASRSTASSCTTRRCTSR